MTKQKEEEYKKRIEEVEDDLLYEVSDTLYYEILSLLDDLFNEIKKD